MIQSGKVYISLQEYQYPKCNGDTYTYKSGKVTFNKPFKNLPVIHLSINGMDNELISGANTQFKIEPYFKRYTLEVDEVSKSDFSVKLELPSNVIKLKYAALNGNLIEASWLAYDEVTIGP